MGTPARRKKFSEDRTLRQQIKKLIREGKVKELMKINHHTNNPAWGYLDEQRR